MTISLTRRGFLGGAGAAGLSTTLPLSALAEFAGAAPPDPDQGILMVVFLKGGNDSINTVGPFTNGVYRDNRLSLAVAPHGHLSAGSGLYFHPALGYLRQRFGQGDVAVVQGVDQPDDDHSHFSSTTTWMTGRPLGEPRSTGWLGRWLDAAPSDVLGASVDGGTAQQIRGTQPKVVGVARNTGSLLGTGTREQPGNQSLRWHDRNDLSPMGELFGQSLQSASRFSSQQLPLYNGVERDSDRFVADLQRAAHLLNLGLGVRVVSATLGGFDTHSEQSARHTEQLTSLDRGLAAFFRALLPALHGQTCVLVVSEFGRRLRRNNSLGTDHGAAGTAFLVGQRVRGGLTTPHPSLTDLTRRGDLRGHTDFRSIYTTIAQRWLATDGAALLGSSHSELDLFTGGPRGTGVAGFLDVDSSAYYAGALRWAAATGVVTGTSATTFEPKRAMTRGEFATILHRAAGSPAPPAGAPQFSDVPSGAFYATPVKWMAGAGITTGTSPGKFSPRKTLSRGEAATFLWRRAGRPTRAATTPFDDVRRGLFFANAVAWMAAEGITTGTAPGRFAPYESVDRAQAVTFLWRAAGWPSA